MFEQLAPQVINRLSRDLNLTPQQAAGIVGQLGYESAGLQAINEYQPVIPGSRGGFGWAQWTGPRRKQFEAWAQQNNVDITTPEANYGFLVHELQNTPESRALDQIRQAPDAQTAGRVFTDTFLRPGVPAYDKRESWTERALNFIMPTAYAGTLQDARMPTPWKDVITKPEYQALSPEDKAKAQEQYFEQAIAPRTPADQLDAVRSQFFQQYQLPQASQADEPFAQRAGNLISEAGRQVGLTARYGMEGLGQVAGMFSEPIRQGLNVGLRAVGLPEAAPFGQSAQMAADALGLPQPQGANERVVGDVTRLMAGAGGVAGGANALSRTATGITQGALNMLAANPGQQVASAMGAGGAGGAVREAGGGPVAQGVAALAGGLVAPMALSGAQRVGQNIQGRITSAMPDQVLGRLKATLSQSGIDWDALPARVQQQLQREASQALRSGQDLDPAALSRLADFRRIEGATPTRGMLTQDPVQVTREMNLAKQQANTGPMGGRNLAQVQADNNAALVRSIDQLGASSSDDAVTAGQRAIDSLQRRLETQQGRVGSLYDAARDSSGRSFPLDGAAFTQRAGQLLDDNLVAGALPADVRNHLNRIAQGEVPFTVDYAEQLKTMMGRLQRNSSDGSARYALGLVRQALDDAPVLPLGNQTAAAGARAVNPGNLPAVRGDTSLGDEAVSAFNQARSANRSMMRQIERTPALKDLYDGRIAPDNFVQKYITNPSAKAADVQRLGRMLSSDPAARDAIRSSLAQHLKDKALSGAPDDIGAARFSASQFAKALKQIGDRKLRAFFEPQEIAQLHAISRVGRLMSNQPVGSAVNNSNTAATVIGRTLDMMGSLGRGIKILGIGDQVGAIQGALRQRGAQRVPPALLEPITVRPPSERLIPATVYGGLLGLSAVPPGQD